MARPRVTHGMSKTPEWNVWDSMQQRCTNPRHKSYADYGGRGIRVLWSSFEEFYADMGLRPSAKHSIDRRDVNGHYCKDNCRWATPSEQGQNKRSNRILTFNGVSQSISLWARQVGITHFTLHARLDRGWSVEKALTTPLHTQRKEVAHAAH